MRSAHQNVDEFIGRIRDNRTNRIEDLTTWKISTFQWRRVAMALAKNKSMECVHPLPRGTGCVPYSDCRVCAWLA